MKYVKAIAIEKDKQKKYAKLISLKVSKEKKRNIIVTNIAQKYMLPINMTHTIFKFIFRTFLNIVLFLRKWR